MKKRAAQILALFATTYLVVVLLAAAWAFYIDATLLHSQREHLRPDILLLIVTAPSSSALIYLYEAWPEFFSGHIIQVGWLTLCGLGQSWLLFAMTRVRQKAIETYHRQ